MGTGDRAPGASLRGLGGRLAPWLAVVAVQGALLLGLRPERLTGWRDCDTQAIALNLAFGSFDPLRPAIDWGGRAGAVESEPPVYATLVALVLRLVGDVAWPGQVLSALAWGGLALVVFRLAARRHGLEAAWIALAVILSSELGVSLSVRVMPDALAALAYALALDATFRFADRGGPRAGLVLHASTLFAALVKPLALQVGLIQALGMALGDRHRLREPLLWSGWAVVLLVVGAWLAHGHQLFLETGNTFGVLFNGDTKGPTLAHLARPGLHLQLFLAEARYGVGVLGILAVVYLLVRRALGPFDLAAIVAVGLGLYASFRYSAMPAMGPHYHVFSLVHGALFVGQAVATARARGDLHGILPRVMLALWLSGQMTWSVLQTRSNLEQEAKSPALALGSWLRPRIGHEDLIVVRSPKPAYDPFWRRPSNYQEPLGFHAARAKGFSMPADASGAEPLKEFVARGARFYVEPGPPRDDAELYGYLARFGQLLRDDEVGRIYRLSPAPAAP